MDYIKENNLSPNAEPLSHEEPKDIITRAVDILISKGWYNQQNKIEKFLRKEFEKDNHLKSIFATTHNGTVPRIQLSFYLSFKKSKGRFIIKTATPNHDSSKKTSAMAIFFIGHLKEKGIDFVNGYFIDAEGNKFGKIKDGDLPAYSNSPKRISTPKKTADNEFKIKIHPKIGDYSVLYDKIKSATYVRVLQTYINASEQFKDACLKALTNEKCHIQVLVLDPYSEAARLREKSLSGIGIEEKPQIWNKLQENYSHFAQIITETQKENSPYRGKFEFQLFNENPPFTFFEIDSTVSIGFHFFQKMAKDGAYLEMKADATNPLYKDACEQFDSLWQKSLMPFSGDLEFKMHLIRYGQLAERTLHIKTSDYSCKLVNTYNKVDFHGIVIDMHEGNCLIFLQTSFEDAMKKNHSSFEGRIACLFIPIGRNQLADPRNSVTVGKFIVEFAPGKVRFNSVVLEKEGKVSEQPPAEKQDYIEKYLSLPNKTPHSPSEAIFDDCIRHWQELDELLKGQNLEIVGGQKALGR